MSRRVLVVGGSGTLGGAVVDALIHRGARVAATFRRRPGIEPLGARHPGLATFALDLVDAAAIEDVVAAATEALAGLDALVCCTGVATPPDYTDAPPPAAAITPAHWDALMSVNVRGPFLCARAALPRLCEGGAIALVGSVAGARPLPVAAHHAASSAALAGLVRALAKEAGGRGITVNAVAPGLLEAGMSRAIPPALVDQYRRHSALGRSGGISEVAGVLAWLATTNTAVTGQTLVVDGGL